LYDALDSTTSTHRKVAAMVDYFSQVEANDGAWALALLRGQRLKRLVPTKQLQRWACELTKTPEWLFAEAYAAAGDLAETIALLLDSTWPPRSVTTTPSLSEWVEQRLLRLRKADEATMRQQICGWWLELDTRSIFVLNKLLTGGFRVGVSSLLVERAIAQVAGVEPPRIAHRLMGSWKPTGSFFSSLLAAGESTAEPSQPYPFFLASPLEQEPGHLGQLIDWLVE